MINSAKNDLKVGLDKISDIKITFSFKIENIKP